MKKIAIKLDATAFRLGGFYFLYFASVGAFIPYWSLYLQHLGYSAMQIGVLFACMALTRVVSPNVWGRWADRSGQELRIVQWSALATCISFALLWVSDQFWWVLWVTLLFSFLWAAFMPLVEVATFAWAQRSGGHYGRVRLWGSLGFVVLSLGLGAPIAYYGQQVFLATLLALLLCVWLASFALPHVPRVAQADADWTLRRFLTQPGVGWFFFACALQQASHGAYYAFYSIYLQQHGFGGAAIGAMWAFAVLCEIVFFVLGKRLIERFGLWPMLLSSLALTGLRWLLIAAWPGLGWMVFAQVLHAASYGAFHLSAANLVYQRCSDGFRARGQALYSSIANGIGAGVGALLFGWVWSQMGGAMSFALSALVALLALVMAIYAWRRMIPFSNQT